MVSLDPSFRSGGLERKSGSTRVLTLSGTVL